MAFDIKKVPIFSVGVWNGRTFHKEDLMGMVNSYYKLKAAFPGWKPRLKITHDEEVSRKLLSTASAGYLANLEIVGDYLLADFLNVPDGLRPLIEGGAYTRRSVEISTYWEHKGEVFKNVIRACAFLGSEMPAVGSLQDISKVFGFSDEKEIETIDYSQDANNEVKCYYQDSSSNEPVSDSENGENKMEISEEKYQADIAKASAEAAKKALEDFKKQEAEEFAQKNEADSASKKAAQLKEAKELFDKLAIEKKITPAQAQTFTAAATGDNLDELKKIAESFSAAATTSETVTTPVSEAGKGEVKADAVAFAAMLDKCPEGTYKPSFLMEQVARHFMVEDKELTYEKAVLKAEASDLLKDAIAEASKD